MYYGYDPFYDEEPDYLPMTLGQQIRVVYDSDDIVTEHLIDFFNSTRQETYEIIPASTFAVSPETDKVFTLEDTYPERFFKWADDFIQYIRPSCSLAEALEKQDLFINSTLAQLGCNILWKMFRHGMIVHHGLYLNLNTMKVNPIMV